MRVALDGVFFKSTALLRIVTMLGFVISVAGLGLAVFEVIAYFTWAHGRQPGFTTLAVLVLLMAGFTIVSVGVVGLYVGRIFEQVKDRPLYLIAARTDDLEPIPSPKGISPTKAASRAKAASQAKAASPTKATVSPPDAPVSERERT